MFPIMKLPISYFQNALIPHNNLGVRDNTFELYGRQNLG